MEAKNFILLNMMKRQLLDIYRIFEDENPELLDDPTVNEAYEALKTVNEEGEMRHWRSLMRVLELSYTTTEGVERKDNILGELDDLASRADWKVLYDFLEFKCAFDACCWDEIEEKNYRLINSIQQLAERKYDVHIIIIRCGLQWVAVGNDADRLFEIFGWQTSTVYNGEEDVSYMFISDYGLKVLMDSEYSIKMLHIEDEEYKDEIFISDSFNEDLVCANQQMIDYMRLLMRKQAGLARFASEKASFFIPKSGYDYLVNYHLNIFDDKVVTTTDDFKEIVLADGNSWRLDEVGLPYLMNIRPVIGEA